MRNLYYRLITIPFILICATAHSATQQVIVGGFDNDLHTTATEYNWVMGGTGWNGTEANKTSVVPSAGNFDDFKIELQNAPGAGASGDKFVFTVLLDGSSTTLGCEVLETATSCTDSDAFTVTVGQQVTLQVVPTSSPTVGNARWSLTWNPDTADETILIGGGDGLSTSATDYLSIHGGASPSASAGDRETLIPTPGTFDKLYVELSVAPDNGGGTQSRTFAFGTVDCTISELETTCNSAADTQAVTAAQTYELTATLANTPAASAVSYGIIFDPTTEGEFIIGMSSDSTTSTGAERWIVMASGDGDTDATETDAYSLGQAGTFATAMVIQDIYVELNTATGAGNTWQWTMQITQVDSSLTCTVADNGTTCNEQADPITIANGDFIYTTSNPISSPTNSTREISYTGFIPASSSATRRMFIAQ